MLSIEKGRVSEVPQYCILSRFVLQKTRTDNDGQRKEQNKGKLSAKSVGKANTRPRVIMVTKIQWGD